MIELPPDMAHPPDHTERIRVARRFAQWELGDASWANAIVGAYLRPQGINEDLDDIGAEEA